MDQCVLLSNAGDLGFFKAKKRDGAVSVNLTAALDTVWHCGLFCKLLKHLSLIHTSLYSKHSFTFTSILMMETGFID